MTILTESILAESPSARNSHLSQISQDQAQRILAKIKSLYFAIWQGTGIATTEQLTEFFEIESSATIRQVLNRHQEELESDGVKTIRGKALKDVRDILSLTSTQANLTIWTARATLRLAMLLRDSEVAKAIRTTLLDTVEKVIPAQSQEIEYLKLQLELAKTQERLLNSTQAIATLHGVEMLALILGKPDAVITRTEKVETLVAVDHQGRAIQQYDGVGITSLSKRYGFGKNTQACRRWLESIGVKDNQWLSEPALIKSSKLPRDILPWLDRQYATRQGTRQYLIGETTDW